MKKHLLVGLVTLLVIAISSIGFAAALEYTFVLTISPNAKTWKFETTGFSGKDVDLTSVTAIYYLVDDPLTQITIEPKNIHLSKNSVTIQFDSKDLPMIGTVAATRVEGTLNNGADTFIASGPGFAWGRTR